MDDTSFFWIALGVIIVAIVVTRRRTRPQGANTRQHLGVNINSDLLKACHGDRAMAERLIGHEMKKRPDLSPTGATLMALSRLRDDKR